MLWILCYNQDKVLQVPSFCLCSAVHSRDVPSEPVEAPGPGCDSGRDGGTGSTTMSKSDTFQGPGGFRTPSAPRRVIPHPTPTPSETDITKTRQDRHERETERQGREIQVTQHRRRVRLERKGGKKSNHRNQAQVENQLRCQVGRNQFRQRKELQQHAESVQCVAGNAGFMIYLNRTPDDWRFLICPKSEISDLTFRHSCLR